jgi:hypothetical protein
MSESTDEAGGWARTLASADEMADSLREDGWTVVTVRAAHVAPEPPGGGDTDRFGFVYVAPGDVADTFENAVTDGVFDTYTVFNRREGNDLFTLTRVTDTDERIAVLLVGGVDLGHAGELVAAARERDEMYSHVQLLDGTHLGSFHHDDPTPFFSGEL